MFPNIIYSYYFYVFWNFAENIRFYVFQLILFHDRGAPVHIAVQCHLVKGLGGKYFYKLPKKWSGWQIPNVLP